MAQTLTEKILRSHLKSGTLESGKPIGITIDQTLTQDATGTMTYLQFEAMGLERVQNELAVSYVDHNTIQVGFENADDHRYLQSVAAAKGVIFSKPGNGICHQVHLERFGEPGKTLLGSDSHTPTGGGLAMIAIGAGGLDVAVAMAGGPFHLISPRVIEIRLSGALRPWVSAKDVILTVLEHFGTKGNVNCIFEYTGEGVATLQVPERATICNMGAECGVTTSLFPSDENTRNYLKAQGRAEVYRPLSADEAVYDGLFEIDLSTLEPKMACPHSPGNIEVVRNLAGKRVDQVLIGSCTNSSYVDLKKVADILSGHTVAPTSALASHRGAGRCCSCSAGMARWPRSCKAGRGSSRAPAASASATTRAPVPTGEPEDEQPQLRGAQRHQERPRLPRQPGDRRLGGHHGVFTDPLSSHGIPYPEVAQPASSRSTTRCWSSLPPTAVGWRSSVARTSALRRPIRR